MISPRAIFRLSPRQVLIKSRHVGSGGTPAVMGCGNYSIVYPTLSTRLISREEGAGGRGRYAPPSIDCAAFVSTRTPGPIVAASEIFLIYTPFAAVGLAFFKASINAPKFCINC